MKSKPLQFSESLLAITAALTCAVIPALAADHPDKVAALQKRANELAGQSAKSMLLMTEFKALMERMHMPPALPWEEFQFNQEP